MRTKPVLSLKDQFILKQEVKSLYRKIFRTIRQVPDPSHQRELKQWARHDFRSNAHHTDEITIKMYIKYGERCLKELETSLSLSK
ncbi:unnamed protein product [Acanthoscelides obtectus]|uniref:LYR motif-containing protein 2 n=1 Tax=Acanthoscelides obtectus TaxID=200917 RepID=A0A9P0PTX7_ACAOB|nr:unnamed protein product [Acanthoscelides obtectus]CAK1672765.1 LYR motif-containing protein 2 [Acanthoscelides obtectus]